jgi:acyl-CoA synthetase (AMP-forming)/AMP-acid ligase II
MKSAIPVPEAGPAPRAGQGSSPRVVEVCGSPAPTGALTLEQMVRPFGETDRGITFIEGQHRKTLSYHELAARAAAVAAKLRDLGVRPGDRVAATAGNDVESVLLIMGTWAAGAAFVSVPRPSRRDTQQFAERFRRLLASCGCGFVVVDEPGSKLAALGETPGGSLTGGRAAGPRAIPAAALRDLPGHPSDDKVAEVGDLALIQFTSGSVSAPKGVAIASLTLARHAHMIGRESRVAPDDRMVSWLPLYHDMGLVAMFLNALYHRVDLVLMPPSAFVFGPSRWLTTLSAERGTYTAAPDFAYQMAATVPYDEGLDLSGVRVALSGGERLSWRTLQDFFRATEPIGFRPSALSPVYGLAENVAAVTGRFGSLVGPADHVSAGPPLAGVSVRAPAGLPAGPVHIRSEYLFQGYYTVDGFDPAPAGGWYDTGDDGFISDGELYVVGRRAEVASIAGRNVFAEDIEAAVRDAAGLGIRTCAAFRVPGEVQQFGLMAEVPPHGASAPDELAELGARTRAAVTAAVGVRIRPVLLVRASTIPRTPSGKVQRAHCRALHAEGQLGRRLLGVVD